MNKQRRGLVFVRPGEGEVVAGATSGTQYKITGDITYGKYSVVESTIEPKVLQPPHIHSREDHCFIVTEGEIGVRVADEEILAGPGSYVFMPRFVPHAFWNPSATTTARMIQINEPSDFENFFPDFYEITKDGAPDPARIVALMDKYGITFVPDWIPELEAKYGLTGR